MSEEQLFTQCSGTLNLSGPAGKMIYAFEGKRVPPSFDDIPEYVKECVKRVMAGGSTNDFVKLQKQLQETQRMVDKLVAENKELKKKKMGR